LASAAVAGSDTEIPIIIDATALPILAIEAGFQLDCSSLTKGRLEPPEQASN
jgi:hypothetical protein